MQPSPRKSRLTIVVAAVLVTLASQAGVWWVRSFEAGCPRIDPDCGLAMGRTGAAVVATALTLLTLLALGVSAYVARPGRRTRVTVLFAVHVIVALIAVASTFSSTGFVVPT